jgi:D-threonate/D-erythronate kinase
MLEWAVIADDLTGAADTGVQFLPVCAPVFLVDHRRLDAVALRAAAPAALTVFTNSRALPAGDARRAAAAAGRAIRRLGPARVYKKIDSALRGNIGTELEGVMEALELPLSFIAPAFPDQGRITFDGVHRIHGVPVAEGEMGRDPVSPVTDSSLPRWIGGQAAWPLGHVPLGTIEQGAEAVAREVERLQAGGVRHVCFDATAPAHLEFVARLALERFPGALLCGSAGLAQRLVACLRQDHGFETPGGPPGVALGDGGLLFVCGSASKSLRAQAERLVDRCGLARAALPPDALVGRAPWPEAAVAAAAETIGRGDLVLQVSPFDADATGIAPHEVVSGLARFVEAVARGARTAGMFLSGGDTALAVMERLEVAAVRLEREPAGGLGCGVLCGGPISGIPVFTKAGSFGGPETLVELYRRLRPQAALGPRGGL